MSRKRSNNRLASQGSLFSKLLQFFLSTAIITMLYASLPFKSAAPFVQSVSKRYTHYIWHFFYNFQDDIIFKKFVFISSNFSTIFSLLRCLKLDELIFSPLFVLTFTFAWQCNLQGAKEDWPFRNWKWKCTLWSTSQTFRNNIEENIQDSNNQEDFLQRNASAKNDILWICRRIKSFQNRLWIFCALICEYIEQRKLVF